MRGTADTAARAVELYGGGMSIAAVAEAVDRNENTVASYLRAAGVELRKQKAVRGVAINSTEEFVREARKVHGNKYDYSKTEYRGKSHKVTVICPEHGEFSQRAGKHLSGQGCPHIDCVNARRRETNLRRYGTDNPRKNAEVAERIAATCKERYGAETTFGSKVVQEKAKRTIMERYGVEYCTQSPEIQEKIRKTCMEKYGVFTPFLMDDFEEKREATMIEKYGAPHVMQSEKLMAKITDTIQAHYGTDNAMKDPEVNARAKQAWYEKYSRENPEGCETVTRKIQETKKAHGTATTSRPEEELYAMLCEEFGETDVERQYKSEEYPYACDFYIRSRDMYVELNANWTHGPHWFDPDSDEDREYLSWLRERADDLSGKSRRYYLSAIHVWTGRDVEKRETARRNNLNYAVFWENDLWDAKRWFHVGCPDRKDYF